MNPDDQVNTASTKPSHRSLMKAGYWLFLLVSLAFLTVALRRADYLRIPEIVSPAGMAASFVFLFGSLLGTTACWKGMLDTSNAHVPSRVSLASMGLSVFAKYIPGKIWTVAGRAAYVAQKTGRSSTELGVLSLKTQFVDLASSMAFGIIGLCAVGGLRVWGWSAVLLFLVMSALGLGRTVDTILGTASRLLLGRRLPVADVNRGAVVAVLPRFAITWSFLVIGFYFLANSLTLTEVPWSVGFGLPLAVALGMTALVVPGGLGIREGVLAGYLVLAGLAVPEATTVAVAARLWFLLGEMFLFVVGLVAHASTRHVHAADCSDRSPASGCTMQIPTALPKVKRDR